MILVRTNNRFGRLWLERHRGQRPIFACILGFTDTGLIRGISVAGKTPDDRRFTAIADAEFLYNGIQPHPKYPLPPLHSGVSPTFISRSVIESLQIPLYLFDAGLPQPPAVPAIDLGGKPARCVTTGHAMTRETVDRLFQQGLIWGEKLAREANYLVLGECVVGGTTTALAVLTGLGYAASGKVNSSHPQCNHTQKWDVVRQGLQHFVGANGVRPSNLSPLDIVAAVGDPMQVAVAGMTIAASRTRGVMLAGGTQMLAVYALAKAIAQWDNLEWNRDRVVVGTTRWVSDDPTGDTPGLALQTEATLLAANLNFSESRYSQLQAYERGFVKEGVGAGGCAIAAHLYGGWDANKTLTAIENLIDRYQDSNNKAS